MKKLFIPVVLGLFLYGCVQKFDTPVNPTVQPGIRDSVSLPFAVKSMTFLPEVGLLKDSLLVSVSIATPVKSIQYFEALLYSPDNAAAPVISRQINDNGKNGDPAAGDLSFNGYLPFDSTLGEKSFRLVLRAVDNTSAKYLLAEKSITLAKNSPPVILYVTAPDTLTVTTSVSFVLAAKVSDPQGYDNVKAVFYKVYRPNGTSNGFEFTLLDDGVSDGSTMYDAKAQDSLYTNRATVTTDNAKGTYRFEFWAKDKLGALSQPVSHNITLK